MSADIWHEVKQILAAALELDAQERAAYIASACSGNPAQLREVQSLLKAYERGGSALDHSVPPPQALNSGDKLDDYVIENLIGAGGMGEVYCALDTSLGCRVAIKVLPPIVSTEPERISRFEREARAAAALSHPNILSIHRLGRHEGMLYIVSELLVGQTLRALLKEQIPLSFDATVDYALQIASGLAMAHGKGVVHRDIKPENLFVTEHKQVKILDFGLAKAVETFSEGGSRFSTIGRHATEPGAAVGTIAYMSPEQARGKDVGPQSDVFSFGIVLYEITTGKLPFPGETSAIVSEAILNRDPIPPSRLNPHVTAPLETIILRALQKDVAQRYQNGSEILTDLRALKEGTEPTRLRPREKRSIKAPILASISALVILVAAVGYFARRQPTRLTERDTIVLADFANNAGDPVFDGALRQGLSAQLEQSPFLNLLSDDRIAETLALMGQSKEIHLTHDLARQVCLRTDSAATIEGSIANLGSQYVIGLKAVNCHTGDVLAEHQVTAASKERVLEALGRVATELRQKLGEQLSTLQKYDKPLEQVTTPSLEALKAYSLGYEAMDVKVDQIASIPLLQRAINLDPNFAMAYARLATDYANLEEPELAAINARKAYELRGRVSERETFYIASHYEQYVTGNLEASRRNYESWRETYPRDPIPPGNLGVIYTFLGDYANSLVMTQEALKLDPGSGLNYGNLVNAYLQLDRLDDVRAAAQAALDHHLDSPAIHLNLYQADFLQNDAVGMNHEAASVIGKPGYEDLAFYYESDTAAYAGQLATARELTRRADASARQANEREVAAGYRAEDALREAIVGNAQLARTAAHAALELSGGKDAEAISAIALALAGETVQASRLANDLVRRFPEDTIVQSEYLPTIRGVTLIHSGAAKEAIGALAPATSYEMGSPTQAQTLSLSLYPAYLRGEAYLATRNGTAASTEFQKIVDHPGIVVNEIIGALAHLGLGRAYKLTGETSKARTEYAAFLSLWRNADLGIPIFKLAQAEYGELRLAEDHK